MRVFHDRLINQEDRLHFMNILKDQLPKFKFTDEQVFSEEKIIFSDIFEERNVEPRNYCQVTDLKQLSSKMDDIESEYGIFTNKVLQL